MNTKNKVISIFMCLCLALLSACSPENDSENNIQTSLTTTENLDNEVDYSGMAENLEQIDETNTIGTGPKYDPSKTAGHVHALCYYDIVGGESDPAEILAQRFGGTIDTEVVSAGEYADKLGALIATGNSPDIVRYEWTVYPDGISKNMFTPLDDWLNMDSELWAKEKSVIEAFNYAGKHYYYPTNINPNYVIIYNKACIEEAGLEDPMELYKSNNWNWNTFKELTRKWANIDDKHIGFMANTLTGMMFANSTGVKTIDVTGTEIINNLKNPDVERAMFFISDMRKNGLISDDFVAPGEAFVDGNLLFYAIGLTWGYESAQSTAYNNGTFDTNKFVALPLPKDPQSDKYYMAADTYGFLVPSGAPNVQGGVSWILSNRIYETDPETIAENYAKMTDDSPHYYDKCPGCKYDFPGNGDNDLTVCPECNTARKPKFKAVYDKEQMEIISDMKDPTGKFSLIFDNTPGFGSIMDSLISHEEESIFDGPLYNDVSYTTIIDARYQTVEAVLQPYRDEIAKAAAAQ